MLKVRAPNETSRLFHQVHNFGVNLIMADEQTRIFHLIEKKYITFCAKEKIEPNPQFFSKSIKSRQLWIDAVVDLCSGFPNRRLQLGLSLNKEAIKKVIKFLLNAFESMEEHLYLNNAQYDSTLRCCGQLMVYCLTHSCAPTDSYMLFKEDVMDCIKKQITDSSTVECLIAYAVLFINLIKLERKTNYLFEALDMLNDEPDNTCPSDFSRNLSFLFKLFHSNEPRANFYNWSKKNVLASNSGDCIKNVNHCDVFMDSLLTFCLEMKSNHFDAIRYSALDTFENIIVCHLVHCGDCCQPTTVNCALKISCDYLNEVLNRIVCDTCYSRGTIAMLTRFVRCIFKKNVYKTTNLLYSLQSVCDTHGCDTNLNNVCGQVVFGLMKIANDPNSASSISELYTLIAQRLWTENDPLINSWLEGLISVLVHRSNSTFHSTVNQNILPSLMKVNPKLLELLVKCCDAESVLLFHFQIIFLNFHKEVHLSMFLLTCCRLLSTNGAKTDVCKYLSLNFLKSSLGSYDDQLRLTALNVLVSFITKIKQMELLNEKLQLFLDYLRCDMWPNSKHFHSQIICAIKDVLMYILAVMKRGTTEINLGIQDGDIETFSIKMATILLSCIHPGSPAPRLSLGLAGLHTFIDCFYSVFHVDGDSEFMIRIMNCLNQAVTKLFPVVDLSNYQNALNCDKTNHSGLHVCSLLFIGLCSRYDADRDYAVKILLRLEFQVILILNMLSKKNDTRSIATQDWNTFLQTSSLFKEVNGMCIIERIISLGLRISEIVLPVVAHESPEGVLLNSQDDLCTDNKVIEDENDQLSKLREKLESILNT
ncbi:unnamed protein product [Heterobilharzia americana]|nr:unnamed protein product [Heterobilharzia americana]